MTQVLQLRRRRRGPALNPYIVVADFAINLLLVIIVYFLVTARVAEAVYASDEKKFRAAAQTHNLNSKYRLIVRNGPWLYFRFPNNTLFSDASHMSPSGAETMRDMAAVLRSKNCAPILQGVRLTVSYPAEWNVLSAQQNADALVHVLRISGITCPIVTSARSQRDPSISRKQDLSETEFAIEFTTPSQTLAKPAAPGV